jgi:hypothetical protein
LKSSRDIYEIFFGWEAAVAKTANYLARRSRNPRSVAVPEELPQHCGKMSRLEPDGSRTVTG